MSIDENTLCVKPWPGPQGKRGERDKVCIFKESCCLIYLSPLINLVIKSLQRLPISLGNLSTSSWSWGSDLASACLCDLISHYLPPGSLNSRHIALLCVSGLVWVCLCLSMFALASSSIYKPLSPVILGLDPLHLLCLGSNLMFPFPLPHFTLSSSESNFEVCVAFLKV